MHTLMIAALERIMCGKKAHYLVFHIVRFSAPGIDDMMAVRLMFAGAAKQMTASATYFSTVLLPLMMRDELSNRLIV
jgi:hypothetical protein